MGLAPKAGDLDSEADSSYTGGSSHLGKRKRESKGREQRWDLGIYPHFRQRRGGAGRQARMMSEVPGRAALPLPGRGGDRIQQGPSQVCWSWQLIEIRTNKGVGEHADTNPPKEPNLPEICLKVKLQSL